MTQFSGFPDTLQQHLFILLILQAMNGKIGEDVDLKDKQTKLLTGK
jgi:hypothetical protein